MEHIGVGVHEVESQICILTESGKTIEWRIRTQRERIAAVLAYRVAHRTSYRQRHVRAQLAVREALVRTRARYISLTGAKPYRPQSPRVTRALRRQQLIYDD